MASEIDTEKRNQMISEAWSIVQDDVVYLPLHHQVLSWAMNENIDFPVQSENTPLFWTLEYTD
jgi:peptide/nickel transport system substrate-binding protein